MCKHLLSCLRLSHAPYVVCCRSPFRVGDMENIHMSYKFESMPLVGALALNTDDVFLSSCLEQGARVQLRIPANHLDEHCQIPFCSALLLRLAGRLQSTRIFDLLMDCCSSLLQEPVASSFPSVYEISPLPILFLTTVVSILQMMCHSPL